MRLNKKINILENVLLKDYCTYKIGGKSLFLASPKNQEELFLILEFAYDNDLDFFIFGAGSNILFSDNGYSGVAITMRDYEKDKLMLDGDTIYVSAGVYLSKLSNFAKKNNIGGLEFLATIPATVGGAISQNASFKIDEYRAIEDILKSVTVYDFQEKEIKEINATEIEFKYRNIAFPIDIVRNNNNSTIIISAKFKSFKSSQKEIERKIKLAKTLRDKKHPTMQATAGSVFKNPINNEYSAGYLIEKAGLKGKKIGNAKISEKHANFIENLGNAKSKDVLALIENIKREVKIKFNIDLETEINII